MAVQVQKLKILYLMRIFMEQTDEKHMMTAQELCNALKGYGISAERKGIYNDIDTLNEFGMDIIQLKGTNSGYYVGNRQFELPELKLLVDAVQSSKFITTKKSSELIKKLQAFTSKAEAEQLQRQVFISNRPKTGNETIYYNVDRIHTAIFQNKKVRFQYAEWTERKELRFKRNGGSYQISPWALTWDDENYYLIAYDEQADCIKHYRVDKMQHMAMLNEKRLGKEKFKNFNLVAFSKKTFGMYGGKDERVTLLCHNELAGVILDRFGRDVWMRPYDEKHFTVTVTVAVSRQFFGWITGIGRKLQILEPDNVREEYKEYLLNVIKVY